MSAPIAISASAVERARVVFMGNSQNMADSLSIMKCECETLFVSWEGTGSANFHAAETTSENAFSLSSDLLAGLSEQVVSASLMFTDTDFQLAAGMGNLG